LNNGDGQLGGRLPVFLAIPYGAMAAEDHPRLRLIHLFETAEMLARMVVAILIAAHRRQDGTVPGDVADALRTNLHDKRPSFGIWIELVRTLAHQPLPPGSVAEAIRAWAHGGEGRKKASLDERLGTLSQDRNTLAHAGASLAFCRGALGIHRPTVLALLEEFAAHLSEADLIGSDQGGGWRLLGADPVPLAHLPAEAAAEGVWLRLWDQWLPLWPLMRHYRSEHAGEAPDPAPHAFLSVHGRKNQRVKHFGLTTIHPVSVIQDAAFFRLLGEEKRPAAPWRAALDEARQAAGRMVGRDRERDCLIAWAAAKAGVRALVQAGPGLGKSLLMAAVASHFDAAKSSPFCGVYLHHFRRGTAGNSRSAFFVGLLAALGDGAALRLRVDAAQSQGQGPEAACAIVLNGEESSVPPFLIVADGLDEAVDADPDLPEVLAALAGAGAVVIAASRPHAIVSRAFADAAAFPLQPLDIGGIRRMLDALPPAVCRALARVDRDNPGHPEAAPSNAFLAAVAERAAGNPLYVQFLIADLEANPSLDIAALPRGLAGYYQALMQRVGVSDIGKTLPLLLALLAVAEEILPPETLAALVAQADDMPQHEAAPLVEQALTAAEGLIMAVARPDGGVAYRLYHSHFRDAVLAPDSSLTWTLRSARRLLLRCARGADTIAEPALRRHLLRCGVHYALAWGDDGARAAAWLLCQPALLMRRLAETGGLQAMLDDYGAVMRRMPPAGDPAFAAWGAFVMACSHLLRRADALWPADRILLQAACETGEHSAVRRDAEDWLARNPPRWPRWQMVTPPLPAPAVVLEGHEGGLLGAAALDATRLVTWARDGQVRVWDAATGLCLGHRVIGTPQWRDGIAALALGGETLFHVRVLADRREIVGWTTACADEDRVVRRWDFDLNHLGDGDPAEAEEGAAQPSNMVVLADGAQLSVQCDGRLVLAQDGRGVVAELVIDPQDYHRFSVIGDGLVLASSAMDFDRDFDGPVPRLEPAEDNLVHGPGGFLLVDMRQGRVVALVDGAGPPVAVDSVAAAEAQIGRAEKPGALLVRVAGGMLLTADGARARLWPWPPVVPQRRPGRRVIDGCALDDRLALLLHDDGSVAVIATGDGRPLWQGPLPRHAHMLPEFGILLLGGEAPAVWSLRRGTLLWCHDVVDDDPHYGTASTSVTRCWQDGDGHVVVQRVSRQHGCLETLSVQSFTAAGRGALAPDHSRAWDLPYYLSEASSGQVAGPYVAMLSIQDDVVVWDSRSEAVVWALPTRSDAVLLCAGDDSVLLAEQNTLTVLELADGALRWSDDVGFVVEDIRLDGAFALCADGDRRVRLVDLGGARLAAPVVTMPADLAGTPEAFTVLEDGHLLLRHADGQTITVWRLPGAEFVQRLDADTLRRGDGGILRRAGKLYHGGRLSSAHALGWVKGACVGAMVDGCGLVEWHSSGPLTPLALQDDGTLVAFRPEGVVVLRLVPGTDVTTIDEEGGQ
jgi:hypothetical protein